MATGNLRTVVTQLHRLAAQAEADKLSDQQLLERFVGQRNELAFQTLVGRYGSMVLGVCQRMLHHAEDVEDAFQATFVILARKAASLRRGGSLRNWLYGVAYRTAARAKVDAAKRRAREAHAPVRSSADPLAEVTVRELLAALDAELSKLPPQYQGPLLLCYLEGKTREEAAAELGWSTATLGRRLDCGRELLRNRLVRRGVTFPLALLPVLLQQEKSRAAVLTRLSISTIQAAMKVSAGTAAATVASARVVALSEGVLRTMLTTKLKQALGIFLAIALLGAASGFVAQTQGPRQADEPTREQTGTPVATNLVQVDRARLQGVWVFDSAESGEGTDAQLQDIIDQLWHSRMTFTGDQFTLTNFEVPTSEGPRKVNINASFMLRTAHKPKHIDVNVKAGVNAPVIPAGSYHGIYEVEGDTLRLCLPAKTEQDRPTQFKATPGSNLRLFVLKRVPRTDLGKGQEQEKDQRLTVRAVDGDGKPLLFAKIGTRVDFNLFGMGPEWTYWHQMMTGQDGLARSSESLDAISAGGWLIGRHYGRNLVAVEKLTPYRLLRQPITLTMRPACRVHGRLFCPELQRRHIDLGFTCVCAFPDGKPCNIRYGSTKQTFELFLPPGNYTLNANGDKVHTATKKVTVEPGQQELTADIECSLPRRLATLEGLPAPELSEIAAWKNGPPLKLADLRGKCVLLTFWSMGCLPTIQEMPACQEMPAWFDLYDKYAQQGLVVIGISLPSSAMGQVESAAKFDQLIAKVRNGIWKGRDIPFPVALPKYHVVRYGSDIHQEASCKVATDYGITGVLENVLIDRRGNIVATNLILTNPQLDVAPSLAILTKALREEEGRK